MPTSEYLDCELHLTDFDQARLSVAGRDYSGRPTLDEALQRRLLRADLDPTQYGSLLFESLLPGEGDNLLAGYRDGLAIARHEEKRLRFRLHIASTADRKLQDFYWEYLYDPKQRLALGRSRETAFSRYVSVPLQGGEPVAERPPRLLVVISSPKNLAEYSLSQIDLEHARDSIEAALNPLRGLVDYEILDGQATPGRIRDRLTAGKFHALHIHAHGQARDETLASLVLEREDGNAEFVDAESFSEIFEGERSLRLITLIACHSGVQTRSDPFSGLAQALVQRGLPVVVAMRRAISVDAAALFTEHFYRNLARCSRVDAAANEARLQMHLANRKSIDWGTPTVFMRLEKGLLWKPGRVVTGVSTSSDFYFPWPAVLQCIRSGNVVPVLGPGMCNGLLPTNEEIASRWARDFNFPPLGPISLPRVAQFLHTRITGYPYDTLPAILADDLIEREAVNERERLLSSSLSEVIQSIAERHFDRDENEPHRILAELPLSNFLTTNYDSFMTAALTYVNKRPLRKSCIWNRELDNRSAIEKYESLEGTPQAPLVFHLYGNDEEATSQVLTEDDHLDFLGAIVKDFEYRIPSKLGTDLSDSMLLFLGYNVSALNCRVLFRGLVNQLREPPRRARLAVFQFDADDRTNPDLMTFIDRYCTNMHIQVYDGTVREFLTELRNRLRGEHASH